MLLELLRKEFLLNKRHFALLAAVFGLYMGFMGWRAVSPGETRFSVVLSLVWLLVMPVTLFTREDKFQAVGFHCSLPVTRREFIRARYVLAWLLVGGGAVLTGVYFLAAPWSAVRWEWLIDPDTLCVAALFAGAGIALLLPFTVRFGVMGVVVFFAALQGLGVVFFLVAAVGGGQGFIRELLSGVATAYHMAQGNLGLLAFAGLLVAGLALMNVASYRLSVWVFGRRDL
jgi:hypothetical protein